MKKQAMLILTIFFIGCGTRSHFTPLGTSGVFPSKGKGCPLEILNEVPQDRKYKQIGVCRSSNNDYIEGNINKAFEAVTNCACENGGNAIVYKTENDKFNYDIIGQITSAHTSAIVLFIEE